MNLTDEEIDMINTARSSCLMDSMTTVLGQQRQALHYADELSKASLPWTKTSAAWVISGPWRQHQCVLFDLRTGEAVSYAAQAEDNLSEQDIFEHWDL
eukprot:8266321-Pyramimonas_sp.AAC.1